jgi:hypothetical protein
VAPSLDVIAYLREVLRQAGHGVMTSDNLPDALMLVRATRPKLIVMSADFRSESTRRRRRRSWILRRPVRSSSCPRIFPTVTPEMPPGAFSNKFETPYANRRE